MKFAEAYDFKPKQATISGVDLDFYIVQQKNNVTKQPKAKGNCENRQNFFYEVDLGFLGCDCNVKCSFKLSKLEEFFEQLGSIILLVEDGT